MPGAMVTVSPGAGGVATGNSKLPSTIVPALRAALQPKRLQDKATSDKPAGQDCAARY
jgi:hypothetical protein